MQWGLGAVVRDTVCEMKDDGWEMRFTRLLGYPDRSLDFVQPTLPSSV